MQTTAHLNALVHSLSTAVDFHMGEGATADDLFAALVLLVASTKHAIGAEEFFTHLVSSAENVVKQLESETK